MTLYLLLEKPNKKHFLNLWIFHGSQLVIIKATSPRISKHAWDLLQYREGEMGCTHNVNYSSFAPQK